MVEYYMIICIPHIDGLCKTGDAPGHKPRLLLLVVLRILVVEVGRKWDGSGTEVGLELDDGSGTDH